MGLIGPTVAAPYGLVKAYAELLVKDIPAGDFAKKPKGIDANSPAFNFGHLCVYPDRLLEMLGRMELMKPDPRYAEWFAAGKVCVDDPECKVYPGKDEIMSRFFDRYGAAAAAVSEASDEVLRAPNPSQNERMRSLFPQMGMMCAFLLDGHCQTHLGQVSVWRRCMGLPSAGV